MPPNVRELLKPFQVDLSDSQVCQLLTYLDLLLRWNQKINLTAIQTPEECVTRHFGESFALSHKVSLEGSLLDIGSGAGFPGLALKILGPELKTVLLEPVGKKRAFLREVSRACHLNSVKVVASTIEEVSSQQELTDFDLITMRAVGKQRKLLPHALNCLKPGGRLCLWLGSEQIEEVLYLGASIAWSAPLPIPQSQRRQILIGTKLYN